MRHLTEFTALEWLELLPLQHAAKQLRNDAWLELYCKSRPEGIDAFLESQKRLRGKVIGCVVAFEQPWALNWMLRMAKRNAIDVTLLVFDNSQIGPKRAEIAGVCKDNGAPYLALPPNLTRHVNRSHGMAMTWIYRNIVTAIQPHVFGFLDHDLIPVNRATVLDKIEGQPVYGLANVGKYGFWSLWAGYSFFDFGSTSGKPVNFLYDFSRDLDTGGRNWNALYSHIDRNRIRVASFEVIQTTIYGSEKARAVQMVDANWLHVGGVSYNDTLGERIEFFQRLLEMHWESGRT